mmetsp:Transcript_77186/g.195971  ORF Transcript_77186/g.195971 Transcript_77186/m.195971 type:complete len:253 (-) Transcript_77186:67-825(-)
MVLSRLLEEAGLPLLPVLRDREEPAELPPCLLLCLFFVPLFFEVLPFLLLLRLEPPLLDSAPALRPRFRFFVRPLLPCLLLPVRLPLGLLLFPARPGEPSSVSDSGSNGFAFEPNGDLPFMGDSGFATWLFPFFLSLACNFSCSSWSFFCFFRISSHFLKNFVMSGKDFCGPLGSRSAAPTVSTSASWRMSKNICCMASCRISDMGPRMPSGGAPVWMLRPVNLSMRSEIVSTWCRRLSRAVKRTWQSIERL